MLGEFGFKASYSQKEIPSLAQNGYLRQLRTNIFFYAESGAYFNNKPSAPRTRMKCL